MLLAGAGAALATAACGGKVVVDLTGAGGTTTTTSSSGTGGSTGDFNPVTSVGVTSSGGGGCLNSCTEALSQGGSVCSFNGLGSMNYSALYTCGCGASVCAMACNFSLCTATPLTMECATCLSNACGAALKECEGS
jgi:hypothetical protein